MNSSRTLLTRLVLTATVPMLAACATSNGVRWTYGKPSIYRAPDASAERGAIRAVAGLPLIIGSVAFDAVTWPFQLMFGVWPMWGNDSTQMVPPDVSTASNRVATDPAHGTAGLTSPRER